MLAAMNKVMNIRPDTLIFCGHEYTLKNMEFCMIVEGNTNPEVPKAQEKFKAMIEQGLHTVPSCIRDEMAFNVFMRCNEASVQQAVGNANPETCMHILREWKNSGNKPSL